MSKNIFNKLLLPSLVASMFTTNALASDRATYIGLKLGSLDFDKIVIANTSGIQNTGPYAQFEDVSSLGFEMQWFKGTSSAFTWGYGFDVLLNDGEFVEGGMLDFDFKLGASIQNFKIYGILGVGVQLFSDYTAAGGSYIGLGTTIDITDSFAFHATYTDRSMTTVVSDYSNDFSDDQDYESSGLLVGISYRY